MGTLQELVAAKATKKTEAQGVIDAAKAAERGMTGEEMKQVGDLVAGIAELDSKIDAKASHDDLVAAVASVKDTTEATPAAFGGRSLSDAVLSSEGMKDFRARFSGGIPDGAPINLRISGLGSLEQMGIGSKANITTTISDLPATRLPGYTSPDVQAPLSVLDLITTGPTASSLLEYAVVTVTDNAALVAEGALKPESDPTITTSEARALTYADGFTITNQELADDGALAAIMNQRVQYHIRRLIANKVLNGPGGAGEPTGILATTGVQAQAFDTDVLTTIARAVAKVEAVEVTPQAVIMNPTDAWNVRLIKDGQGRYLGDGPFSRGSFSLWGVPVVTTSLLAAGSAVLGNFSSVMLLQREALSVVAFNQHSDYAKRNLTYVRAEARMLQMVRQPSDIVVADLTV